MEQNNDHGDKHVYDGIVEENNPMPSWWIALFILCISFAFVYWVHYTLGEGVTLKEEYKAAVEEYKVQVEKAASSEVDETEESLAAFMKNENAIHEGSEIFSGKCAMCHGEHLEGKIGPNLTDQFWTTGDGSRMAVIHTIRKGSAVKGMPPWEGLLKPREIKDVAAFIYSKIGSNPANAKAPEGTEVKR